MYFAIAWAEPLVRHRERAITFAYGHLLIFAAGGDRRRPARRRLRARGARGDRAGRDDRERRDPARRLLREARHPLLVLMRTRDPFHLVLTAATAALLALALLLAAAGVSVAVCLVVLALVPVVTVVGYETVGHRHMAEQLERL
jgi:Flp pilus assembly protein TadB